jgi:hypothetical protein
MASMSGEENVPTSKNNNENASIYSLNYARKGYQTPVQIQENVCSMAWDESAATTTPFVLATLIVKTRLQGLSTFQVVQSFNVILVPYR